jgi:hypothetical protein
MTDVATMRIEFDSRYPCVIGQYLNVVIVR